MLGERRKLPASREAGTPGEARPPEGPPPSRSQAPRSPLRERHLAHIWEGQRFPPSALSTRDGRRLGVVYRGRAVGGPGPDFRDAIIEAPWGILRGDVELHVRASDFNRHGHDRDAAYNGVALHVVFWDDDGKDTLLASGRPAAVATLAPPAEMGVEEIYQWLTGPALWQEPCRSAPERLGSEAVAATLDSLGQQRFLEKAETMRRLLKSEPADELLWRGTLEALGYGGDRQPFRSLAARVPWRLISAGLWRLPPEQRTAEARRLLLAAASALSCPGGARRGRPANAAMIRLEGAARLAARFCEDGLAASLEKSLSQTAERGLASLLACLQVSHGPQALIGRSRALEILINVLLPYAAAAGGELARQAEDVYGRLPRPAAYGAVRHLDAALGRAIRVDARRQQGMLRLLRQHCCQGGCGRCPLS
ncbi:MAG: DUF2851 family protein [Dehalococcoidia bacterium]